VRTCPAPVKLWPYGAMEIRLI